MAEHKEVPRFELFKIAELWITKWWHSQPADADICFRLLGSEQLYDSECAVDSHMVAYWLNHPGSGPHVHMTANEAHGLQRYFRLSWLSDREQEEYRPEMSVLITATPHLGKPPRRSNMTGTSQMAKMTERQFQKELSRRAKRKDSE